jgi:dipeptidyl aminopeptidase/acylaminoacyl peptidase
MGDRRRTFQSGHVRARHTRDLFSSSIPEKGHPQARSPSSLVHCKKGQQTNPSWGEKTKMEGQRQGTTHYFLSSSWRRVFSSSSRSLCRFRRGVSTPEGRLFSFAGDLDRGLATTACSRALSSAALWRSRSANRLVTSASTAASTALDIYAPFANVSKRSRKAQGHARRGRKNK